MASSFRQELEASAAALGKFREAVESAGSAAEGFGGGDDSGGGAVGARGRGAGAGGLLRGLAKSGLTAALALGAEGAAALGEAATPALSAFQATGSANAAGGAGLLSLAEQFRSSGSIGAFVSEAIGASDALDVLGRTKQRSGAVLEELARAGVEVDDDLRQKVIDRDLAAEKRVQDERERIEGELSKTGRIQEAAGADTGFAQIAGLLERILGALENRSPGSVGR